MIEITIKVVDSIMGSGKTSAAIELMNQLDDNKYIYITPYLDEATRIKQSCTNRKFYEPKVHTIDGDIYFKLDSLHKLLSEGRDIATTHALFKLATDETRELIYNEGYTLILDEALEVVRELSVSKDDTKMLLKEWMKVDENGLVAWDTKKELKQGVPYDGKFQLVRSCALNNNLVVHNGVILLWSFPPNIFSLFKETYILTYLFHSQLQKYYFDLHNIQYTYWSVSNEKGQYKFVDQDTTFEREIKLDIKSKIIIYEGTLNKIGEKKYSLSNTWFNNKKHLHKQLKNNTLNYFNNIMNSKSDKNMWTTYKDFQGKISGKGYTKGFVAMNERSTNKYQNKNVLAYTINRFLSPVLDGYFKSMNINVNQDMYALSELIQWIWRSAIRNNETIHLYIPSQRMRGLLESWMES
ncbi:hypothetical protein [Paenibacillus illinoisensis]|uniref:Protein YonV n=1 Tax=Paenibacillus illinoisensis TaxID=59845 RepID=A0A2W0C6H3_9BACL|nr:hypothetical protein [Paenibacillus illinoisensis]PYY28333.1 Protein YonV [Paenibacillus illinoisensis]